MDSRDIFGLYEAYQSVYVDQENLNEDVDYELDEAKVDQGLSDKDKEKVRNRRQDLTTRSRVFRHVETRGQKSEKGYTHPAVSDNQGNQPGKYLHLKHQKRNNSEYDGPVRGGRKSGDSYYEEVDLYDIVLDHLLDEGYCDDVESAEVIMANMSEEWLDGILDEATGDDIRSVKRGSKTVYTKPDWKDRSEALVRRGQGREYHRNPYQYGTSREVEKARKTSLTRLNAQKNQGDHEVSPIHNVSFYPEVPTNYRARRRRASGR